MLTVQDKLRLLMWDRRYVTIPAEIPAPEGVRTVIMRDPVVEDWNYFLYIRRLEEQKSIEVKVPTEREVFKTARESDYWTEEDDRVQKEADDHIKFLESEISGQKFASRKKLLERQLKETEKLRSRVLAKSNYLKTQTSEYQAHEVAVFHLLMRVALNVDGTLFWPDDEAFLQATRKHPDLIAYLSHHLLTESLWDEPELREIARNAEWRLVWTLNKENLSGLFDRPIGDLNMNQKMLVYWSRVYDIGYEDPDRPSEDTFQDDDKYDEWLANRDLERKEGKMEGTKAGGHHHEQGAILDGEFSEACVCGIGPQKTVGLGLKKPHAADCPFGTFRYYTAEEKSRISKEVYNRNSAQVRSHINQEHDAVGKHGTIEEQDLRKKRSRILLGSDSKVFKK